MILLEFKISKFPHKINLVACKIPSNHCLQSLPSKAYPQENSRRQCNALDSAAYGFHFLILQRVPLGRTLQDVSRDLVNSLIQRGFHEPGQRKWLSVAFWSPLLGYILSTSAQDQLQYMQRLIPVSSKKTSLDLDIYIINMHWHIYT